MLRKPIELLVNKPKQEKNFDHDFNLFVDTIQYALAFAPDRIGGHLIRQRISEEDATLIGLAEIEKGLEKEFFNTLYIDRIERIKIERYIPAQRLTLVHGLMGTGKTVLLMRVKDSYANNPKIGFHYFDLKGNTAAFETLGEKTFTEALRELVYTELFTTYINGNQSNIEGWLHYRIKNSPAFVSLRQLIQDKFQRPLEKEEWVSIVNSPEYADQVNPLLQITDLALLMNYLNDEQSVILCIDNVDRYELQQQREIFSTCIDLSNDTSSPILLAIRTTNLRRIDNEGAQADFILFEKLERVSEKDRNGVELEPIKMHIEETNTEWDTKESIRALLEKRLNFVRNRVEFSALGEIFKSIMAKQGKDWKTQEYLNRFWKVFDNLSYLVSEEHLYRYGNFNLRNILIVFFSLINRILLYPDGPYTFDKLIPQSEETRITELRNFVYKWIVCNDSFTPEESSLLNVFGSQEPKIYQKEIRFLSYLANHQRNNKGILVKKILDDFRTVGIGPKFVYEMLEQFSESQYNDENTLIWVDSIEGIVDEKSVVHMMPAGRYFLERLAVSREYAFWMILNTAMEEKAIEVLFPHGSINYEKTYDEKYKLDLILRYYQTQLKPVLEQELPKTLDYISLDAEAIGSKYKYFSGNFQFRDKTFEERLLVSVRKTIDFSRNLSIEEKDAILRQYDEAINDLREFHDQKLRGYPKI